MNNICIYLYYIHINKQINQSINRDGQCVKRLFTCVISFRFLRTLNNTDFWLI